ncbi:hypothetical protein QZH41_014637 [Actinostola sp. cb2023]|nr:hypothetical protein QZH41_014637 [Actinostola sp. cb2023]
MEINTKKEKIDSSPAEESVSRVTANRIECSPLGLVHNTQPQTRDHIIFNPHGGSKPPMAPTSVERGNSVHSRTADRRRSKIGSRTPARRHSLSDQRSSSLDNLSLNATGLVVENVVRRHGTSRKGQLIRGKLAAQTHNTSQSDPEIFTNNEPLVASGLAIHVPSTEDS